MTNNDYPRLWGGTFFILVLQALRQRMKAREHYKGESDGLKDPNVLVGLIKVINPDYQEPSGDALKGKTNDFKSCKTSTGQYLPFGDTVEVEEFDSRVQTAYASALGQMDNFVGQFLETGTAVKKDERLVKALIDLIQQDKSIDAEEEFYILETGEKIKKAALGDLTTVCLPAFLLGVWHYVVVNRKDNQVGKDTYNQWCPLAGGGPRAYKGSMGKSITQEVSVYTNTNVADEVIIEDVEDGDPNDDIGSADDFSEQAQSTQGAYPVVNNNPLFIQQNGDGNVVMPNYGAITINFGKK
jgi:hypothetical protein|nr:MAG TPA: hypothetical protein [Caudoviricetes sp.]DAV84011.1 MAG TPA: hypothetical protein [Bacteriophage sp.]